MKESGDHGPLTAIMYKLKLIFSSNFSILLLLNFSKGYPLMMKKLRKILACGWSIEANPGFLLARDSKFLENQNIIQYLTINV